MRRVLEGRTATVLANAGKNHEDEFVPAPHDVRRYPPKGGWTLRQGWLEWNPTVAHRGHTEFKSPNDVLPRT